MGLTRKTVPQLGVLRRSSVFLTHGGANSVHEGLKYAVPMVVVPCFGDQPANANIVSRSGVGIAFPMPLESVATDALKSAFQRLLCDADGAFKRATVSMQDKLEQAGGVPRAVEVILQQAIEVRDPRSGGA